MIKVSALVSLYRAEQFLPSCLDNLLSQTLGEQLEIILVNSGSPENEAEIVRQYQANPAFAKRIVYRETEFCSLYAAWNQAIALASGEYLINANADDRLRQDAYEVLANTLDRHPEIALVYGDSFVTDQLDDITAFQTLENPGHWREKRRLDYSHRDLLIGCLCGPQPMWRKSLHEELGEFNADFRVAGDWEFWLRAAERHRYLHLPEILGLYYNNPKGLENSQPEILAQERTKIRIMYFNELKYH